MEDDVRRVGRWNPTVWVKYAQWEEQQKDFRRARSVWERALDTDHRNVSLWLKYVEMEMRHRFVNHARNVWDRAVSLLPRIDQLWYKYIHMEEMLGNVAGARQIFERWMKWEPDHHGWTAYIKVLGVGLGRLEVHVCSLAGDCGAVPFPRWSVAGSSVHGLADHTMGDRLLPERSARCLHRSVSHHRRPPPHTLQMELRYNEAGRARDIYERYVRCLPDVKSWVRYAKFEMKQGELRVMLFLTWVSPCRALRLLDVQGKCLCLLHVPSSRSLGLDLEDSLLVTRLPLYFYRRRGGCTPLLRACRGGTGRRLAVGALPTGWALPASL